MIHGAVFAGAMASIMLVGFASIAFDAPLLSRKWRANYKRWRGIYLRTCELIERGYEADYARTVAEQEQRAETLATTALLKREGLEQSSIL